MGPEPKPAVPDPQDSSESNSGTGAKEHASALQIARSHFGSVDSVEVLGLGKSSTAWRVLHGGNRSVLRIPIEGSGRNLSYRFEAHLAARLAEQGHPVCRWTVEAEGDGLCSIGPELLGSPVEYDQPWSAEFASGLADVLRSVHNLPHDRYGPLVDTNSVVGESDNELDGIRSRWSLAAIWPFDESDFADHPIWVSNPELAQMISPLRSDILGAAGAPYGVLHSDLHRLHLFVEDERLSGVLDFGAAFIGSIAWDFALVRWYYGDENLRLFGRYYPNVGELAERGFLLACAVGCYKLAKNPSDPAVARRMSALLDGVSEWEDATVRSVTDRAGHPLAARPS